MKIDKSLMTGSTTLLVLSLLAREEMYGYQMITELARRSDHTFELKEGTLYHAGGGPSGDSSGERGGDRPGTEVLPHHPQGPESLGGEERGVERVRAKS